MRDKYKILCSNTIIFTIGTIGSKLITFLLVPLYTNILTLEEYGTADLVTTCSYLIVPVAFLVIQDAVLRFGISKQTSPGPVALNALVITLLGSAITVLMTPLIGLYRPLSEWKWYLTSMVIANGLTTWLYVYAKVKDQNKLFSGASILHAFTLAIVNILLIAFFHCGVKGYLLANIAANVTTSLLIIWRTHIFRDIKGVSFDRLLMRQMLCYCLPLILNNLSWWVLNSSDRMMLEHYLSASELGLYTAAAKIPALLSVVTSIFANAWSISSIKEYENEQDKKFYSNVFAGFSLAMHIGASGIILITKPFMSVYVGSEFFISWKLVPLLVLGAVYYAYSSFFGAIYDAVKKNIIVAMTTLLAAAVNISINFLLIPRIGTIAACVSTAIGYGVIGVYRMLNSKQYFSFPIHYGKLIRNSSILIIQTVMVTLDFYPYLVSVVALALLLICNLQDVFGLISMVLSLFHKKRV